MPKETRKKRRKRKGGEQDLCKLYNNTHFPKKTLHSRFNTSRSGDGGGPPPKEDVEELKKLRPVSGRLEAAKKAKEQDEKTAKKAAAEKAHARMRTSRARIFSGDAMGTDTPPGTDKYPSYKRKLDKERADKYCEENYLEDGTPITPGRPSRRRRANTCTELGCRWIEEVQELDSTSSSEVRPAENFQDLAREQGVVPWDASNPGSFYISSGGIRKTRRKKRRKKKRKTKKRRKKRNRKKKIKRRKTRLT